VAHPTHIDLLRAAAEALHQGDPERSSAS
jgi:hypothetical protein